jgi:signal recognition particle GTPase
MPRTNKELLKDVLLEGSRGAALGTGAGMLLNSSQPLLKDFGNTANVMDRFGFHRKHIKDFPQKALPAMLGLGTASYNIGQELGNELFDRTEEKIRAKKKKRD